VASVTQTPKGEVEYSKDAGDDDGSAPSIRRVSIERTDNGGFVVNCMAKNFDGGKGDKTYALDTRAQLDDMLDDIWGSHDESDDTESESGKSPETKSGGDAYASDMESESAD